MQVQKEKEQDREKASSTGALECFPLSGGEDGAGGEGGGCCFVAWPFEEYVVRDPMNECTINASPHLLNYNTILRPLNRPGPRLPPPEYHCPLPRCDLPRALHAPPHRRRHCGTHTNDCTSSNPSTTRLTVIVFISYHFQDTVDFLIMHNLIMHNSHNA